MPLAGKIQAELHLKAPAEKLYKKWRSETHHLPDAVADHIHAVEVHEGDWESHGSVKIWTYSCEGKKEVFKEKVEIDDADNAVTLVGVGGNVMEEMKSYKVIFQFVPAPDTGGTIGKIIIEYEKLTGNMRDPTRYLGFLINVIRDLDAHLIKDAEGHG